MSELAVLAKAKVGDRVPLPEARRDGAEAVEKLLARRRSVRRYRPDPLSLADIAQLLWSAQGITADGGLRAAPSAGARYPLELYLACAEGLFRYLPAEHGLEKTWAEDVRPALCAAAFGQSFVGEAPVSLLFAAVYARTTRRYHERGVRYVHIDVGHAAENVHLQAEALGLASVPVGAFDDAAVAAAAHLPKEHEPLYVIPVGRQA